MRDSRKIFIPLTLDNSTKRMFSNKQIIGIAVCAISVVLVEIYILRLYDTLSRKMNEPIFVVIGVNLVALYLVSLFFRKVVLRENEAMKNYQDNQRLQKTDISFCWDIFAVKDNKIYYCDGTQGVLIGLSHGYLLDRPTDQDVVHREAIKRALGTITKQGFSFLYFNREVKDSNLAPLEETERRLSRFQGQPIYATANSIIRYTYNLCRTIATTEQEYYLILAKDMYTINRLDAITKEFLNCLHGSIYVKMEILNNEAIWDFIAKQFGIGYIDTGTLLTKKFESSDVQLVFVEEVIRKDVDTNTESAVEGAVTEEQTTKQEDFSWLEKALADNDDSDSTGGVQEQSNKEDEDDILI